LPEFITQIEDGEPVTEELVSLESKGEEVKETTEEEGGTTEKGLEEIPIGRPESVPGYKRVVSKVSYAQQWIPPEAKQFRDWVTLQVEDVV